MDEDQLLWDALSHQEKEEVRRHACGDNRYTSHQTVLDIHAFLKEKCKTVHGRMKTINELAVFKNSEDKQWASHTYKTKNTGLSRARSDEGLSEFGIDGVQVDESTNLNDGLDVPLMMNNDLNVTDDGSKVDKRSRQEYVFLKHFRRRPMSEKDGWGAVSNLDLFFASIYNFYYFRGFMPIFCNGLVNLVRNICWDACIFSFFQCVVCYNSTTYSITYNLHVIDDIYFYNRSLYFSRYGCLYFYSLTLTGIIC